ncbi:MAG: phosphoglycerate kinase, partial [Dehalococcoidales bacterium]|nr:phosphoglycerate kinase [Dehalococcoidales bacterium]
GRLADIYVNDAFGTSHRTHASIVRIAEYLPSVAGLLLEKELETLGSLLKEPAHPFGGLFGGAKVSDKVGMLENIMNKVDFLLIGGGMAATFLKAKSYEVGQSLVELDSLDTAASLMENASRNGVNLLLPVDVLVADSISVEAKGSIVPVNKILPNQRIVDIGRQTTKLFYEALRKCQTIFWNGPMGICEIPQFAEGTQVMAKLLASLEATTIIGGGSTAEVVSKMGLDDKVSFISTGGGASLSYLGGKTLPGVEALLNKDSSVTRKLKELIPPK